MTNNDVKINLNNLLDNFSNEDMNEFLNFLKSMNTKQVSFNPFINFLERTWMEDEELISKLAE